MTAVTRAAARRSASPQSAAPTSPVKPSSSPSDGEDRIRPTRKKLEKTSIGAPEKPEPSDIDNESRPATEPNQDVDDVNEHGSTIADYEKEVPPSTKHERPRPRRKRSFEESTEEPDEDKVAAKTPKHLRKRWRDVGNGESFADGDSVSSGQGSDPADPEEDSTATNDVPSDPTSQTEAPIPPPAPSDSDVQKNPQNKPGEDLEEDKDTNDIPQPETSQAEPDAETSQSMSKAASAPEGGEDDPEVQGSKDGIVAPAVTEDEKPGPSKIPSSSGFANSSTQSPFATLSQKPDQISKEPAPATTFGSAPASGFAALAGSSQSPFGALAPQKPDQSSKHPAPAPTFSSAPTSGFAALGANTASSFASATRPSAFGSQSGFGQLSNGFKTSSGFGAVASKPLASFASAGSSGVIGTKQAKPFGAPVDEEEEAEAASGTEDEPEAGTTSADDEHKDRRFFEQDVETGEEDEITEFNNRAKLYMAVEKQWKERGTGNLKINSRARILEDDENTPYKLSARFLMRADGSHRIVLNSPITKEIKIEDPTGGTPSGGRAVFLGFVDDKPAMLQVKMRSNVQTQELHDVVVRLQKGM